MFKTYVIAPRETPGEIAVLKKNCMSARNLLEKKPQELLNLCLKGLKVPVSFNLLLCSHVNKLHIKLWSFVTHFPMQDIGVR